MTPFPLRSIIFSSFKPQLCACLYCVLRGGKSHLTVFASSFLYNIRKRNEEEAIVAVASSLCFTSNMTFSSYFCLSPISPRIDRSGLAIRPRFNITINERSTVALKGMSTELFGQRVGRVGAQLCSGWSFVQGSRVIIRPKLARFACHRKGSGIYASWLASSQIASGVFTLGTAAVLPFYTLMVVAPRAEVTKKSMESSIPYVVLGLLYAYLLHLSWTPDTIRLMFASKYWLPELPGIARMFSNEITLASAWIHLLAVDLFAARQVFHDGLENEIETRHSVSLCLLFCPVGIVTHFITKALTKSSRNTKHIM